MSQRLHPPSCDDDLAALLLRATHDLAPPAARRAAVLALAAADRTDAAGIALAAGAFVRRIVAEWVGGGARAGVFAPAFGVRGAADGSLRRLYRAEQCEIDVRLVQHGEGWQLAGQLFGVDTVREVVLGAPRFEASVQPDVTQAFVFPDLPAGSYSLTVKTDEIDIVIPSIDMGAAVPA